MRDGHRSEIDVAGKFFRDANLGPFAAQSGDLCFVTGFEHRERCAVGFRREEDRRARANIEALQNVFVGHIAFEGPTQFNRQPARGRGRELLARWRRLSARFEKRDGGRRGVRL